MAVSGAQVTATTTATALTSSEADASAGQSVTFWCSVALAVGGSGVTWATGAQLAASTPMSIDLNPAETVYVATESGTATVHVVHQGV